MAPSAVTTDVDNDDDDGDDGDVAAALRATTTAVLDDRRGFSVWYSKARRGPWPGTKLWIAS